MEGERRTFCHTMIGFPLRQLPTSPVMRSAAIALLLSTLLPLTGLAQEPEASSPSPDARPAIEVMLLGTVHLDNPGRDVNNPRVPDVLTERKQRELMALRDSLAPFRPTKMAIEVRKQHQPALDSLYRTVRAGRMDTSFAIGDFVSVRSEQYQLGVRLARRMGHERVWAVDHFLPMRFGRVQSFAKKNDPALLRYLKAFSDGPLMTDIDSLLQKESLVDLYRFLNRPETVERFRAPNVRMAAAAGDTSFVGADVIAEYHKRNLRIFANLASIAEPGDRIIAIFGAGHMPYLRPLVAASPRMTLVEPNRYLARSR